MKKVHSHWGHILLSTLWVNDVPGLEDIHWCPADKELQDHDKQHADDATLGTQTLLSVGVPDVLVPVDVVLASGATPSIATVTVDHNAIAVASLIICIHLLIMYA